ncbi:MAG: leucine-rich repeat domain-containing protein [Peptococcaceae bacterium]|nr:leucine-rich repeat domain-containing protein [Peptococcaceae bacterium]
MPDLTARGSFWKLDTAGGKLIISNDSGMSHWIQKGKALYGNLVKSVKIRAGVTAIGKSAFSHCTNLADISLPPSLKSIGSGAFCHCNVLTSVALPSALTAIGDDAFRNCPRLTRMNLPPSLETLGGWVFYDCQNLAGLNLPASLKALGDRVFDGCKSLGAIRVDPQNPLFSSDPEGQLFDKEKTALLRYMPAKSRESYVIPDTVTKIGPGAFESAENLKNIIIPSGVTEIGRAAFRSCRRLEGIVIPPGVKSIAMEAFANCAGLFSVTIDGPSSLEKIGDSAFRNCAGLISISLPSSLKGLGNNAFYHCHGLKDVAFEAGASLEKIEDGAFFNCAGLIGISLPSSLKSLGSNAFYHCGSLGSVEIPCRVTSIGINAFSGCANLGSITVHPENPAYSSDGEGVLYDKKKTTLLQYPPGKKAAVFSIPASVTKISNYAFSDCHGLESISVPPAVESIGCHAFLNCQGLEAITVAPENPAYSSDGGGVLYDKEKSALLQYPPGKKAAVFTIPASVIQIRYLGFYHCQNLAAIMAAPENAAYSSDEGVLYDKAKSALLQYPAGKKAAAFSIPASVTQIQYLAFLHCQNLTAITVDAKNPVYSSDGQGVLYNQKKTVLIQYPAGKQAAAFSVPASVTEIGDGAFSPSQSLKQVCFPASLKKMAPFALKDCRKLSQVTFQSPAPPAWNIGIFDGISHPLTLLVPPGSKEAYEKQLAAIMPENSVVRELWPYPAAGEE